MRIISRKTLKDFWEKHKDSEIPLKRWYQGTKHINWKSPNELKKQVGDASIIYNKRVVFNIKGDNYRLVADIEYHIKLVFIIWIGTHDEYNKVNIKNTSYVKSN